MYPINLSTDRLSLREITTDDVDAIHAIYGSAEATRHLSFAPRSRAQVGGIVARSMVTAVAEPRTEYALAASTASAGLIGYARLALDGQRAAQIGFALHPSVWGRGLGTDLVAALLQLGFNNLGLHRVWAARAPKNTASSALLRRVGMVEEGTIRDHVHVGGAWRDSVTHSILEHEWAPGTRDYRHHGSK
ncbi:GNAT family N-acetyltransferase [Streptomyces profundus]|uniref:GNAT family N-acetyltransferase n=1 Tax=Streptomyces profundus TaxID=2867410 RepID=UPI001D16CC66|nr:GNAT family protein [Streptomyces sp. MA3_2.13]UED86318.1 GNAT family N-acetyltransferase [Streptomyces sp. MA3_2.13]